MNPLFISFLICWQGNYLCYFPYFLHSCHYNLDIDFFIFTNNSGENLDLTVNVKIIPYSIEKFKKDAAKDLGFDVAVESGYKFCDFKPAYRYIFSEWIKNYNFWGYYDVDIIFGNIRIFMTNALLSEYDIISARHDYLTGCCCIGTIHT